jgi:hypothetical protein
MSSRSSMRLVSTGSGRQYTRIAGTCINIVGAHLRQHTHTHMPFIVSLWLFCLCACDDDDESKNSDKTRNKPARLKTLFLFYFFTFWLFFFPSHRAPAERPLGVSIDTNLHEEWKKNSRGV